ncbi:MAG: hypothetical protein HYT87_05465 [Nitrospirae bacterium]|nr:hypothetical protein [Nitrospirota bacterium]
MAHLLREKNRLTCIGLYIRLYINMTGQEIEDLRECLGLSPIQLAKAAGVHPSSIFRWEAAGGKEVRLDPLARQVLGILQSECLKLRRAADQRHFGKEIAKAAAVGGLILAAGVLAARLYGTIVSPQDKGRR